MTRYRLCVLFCIVGVCMMLGGCAQVQAAMKALFGYDDSGNVDPNSVGGIASTYANYLVPGLGALITGVAGAFGHATVKKHKKLTAATFDTIEAHGDESLKKKLQA